MTYSLLIWHRLSQMVASKRIMVVPNGIVVVPKDTDSLQSFIKRVQNNIVLIEAKE